MIDGVPCARAQRQVFVRTQGTLAVATLATRLGKLSEELDLAHSARTRIWRQLRRNERQIERRVICNVRGTRDHTRVSRESSLLFRRATQTRGGSRRKLRVELVQTAAMTHCGKCARHHMVARHGIRHIVGGHRLHPARSCNAHQCIVAPHIQRVAVIPHLHQHAVTTECVDQQLE